MTLHCTDLEHATHAQERDAVTQPNLAIFVAQIDAFQKCTQWQKLQIWQHFAMGSNATNVAKFRQIRQTYANERNSDPVKVGNKFNEYFTNVGPNLASKIPTVNTSFEAFMSKTFF